MQALNPKAENLQPLRPFLEAAPIRILGTMIQIKEEVENYLDRTFYNLTTVALHDWRTYADMRSLAQEKLGVKLTDSFLPMGSLEQGLDVLQIMRNIHIFVSRFSYNMNMQLFVEFKPDRSSKHLNTIKIQSIAASLRQHGLGVLNTTVNFTYKFLSQKFNIFSQFLYDDYIRGHLSREHRWFKKHRNDPEINNMYPYDRALKFVRDIRRLGVDESGKSFLDQFRILITEIGNALGYIRMVRSASMYYCSEAVKFLPEIDNNISFEQHAGKGVPAGTSCC
jgi:WASH complex subunit 7